jgi:hypothetical protein
MKRSMTMTLKPQHQERWRLKGSMEECRQEVRFLGVWAGVGPVAVLRDCKAEMDEA